MDAANPQAPVQTNVAAPMNSLCLAVIVSYNQLDPLNLTVARELATRQERGARVVSEARQRSPLVHCGRSGDQRVALEAREAAGWAARKGAEE